VDAFAATHYLLIELRAQLGTAFRNCWVNGVCPGADEDSYRRLIEDGGVDKVEVNKVEVDKVEVDKVEVDKVEVDKVEVDKVEVDKVEVDKVEVDKVENDKVEVDKVEVDKVEVDKVEVGNARFDIAKEHNKDVENTEEDHIDAITGAHDAEHQGPSNTGTTGAVHSAGSAPAPGSQPPPPSINDDSTSTPSEP